MKRKVCIGIEDLTMEEFAKIIGGNSKSIINSYEVKGQPEYEGIINRKIYKLVRGRIDYYKCLGEIKK